MYTKCWKKFADKSYLLSKQALPNSNKIWAPWCFFDNVNVHGLLVPYPFLIVFFWRTVAVKRRTFSYVKRSGECNSHVQYIRFSLLNFMVEFGTLYYLRNMLCPCVKGDGCPQFCVHAGYLNMGIEHGRRNLTSTVIGAWKTFAKFSWTGQGCCASVFFVSLFDCALRMVEKRLFY